MSWRMIPKTVSGKTAGCQGKHSYGSFGEAARAAGRHGGRSAYKCLVCHGYHFGSTENGDFYSRVKAFKRRKQRLREGG